MTPDPIFQAVNHFRSGNYDASETICLQILAGDADNAEINHLLGVIRYHQGKPADAVVLLKRATAAPGASAEMHNNYGAVLNQLGRVEEAITAFNRALTLKPNYADALNNLGVIYRDAKNSDAAIAAFKRAVDLSPNLPQAKANLRSAYRDVVPAWHFAMMDDRDRNNAYEAAIRRLVPGKRVLDIGTGSGLLAMMAARAGASTVTTCEAVGVIADRAREIVARNGLADRVTVIGRPSTDLVAGRDFPERAEVLVTETFASGLIGEGILGTLEHAHQHLLTPDAAVIPAVGSVMGYLAGGDTLKGMLFVDRIADFDLSPFNDFAPPVLAASLDSVPHEALSDDLELLRFDFKARNFPMAKRPMQVTATKAGLCVGVAQWIRLELDSQATYENRPAPHSEYNGHWAHLVHRFSKAVPVKPGDVVSITVRHDRNQVNIDLME
ncbi:MAG TPA: tetratricopeptide repeat protein [Micropepsaceae bacterium]|nr:tetratricopeptide repeat protein [Micropepsaceae bacterium]